MANLQENLERLKYVSNHPEKQLENYLKEGRQVIGTFPYYTPEVIADAAGIIPMGMWGAQTDISQARRYLGAFACPILYGDGLDWSLRWNQSSYDSGDV